MLLKNGFKCVSGRYNHELFQKESIEGPALEPPYIYPTGLVELPIQSTTDRHWFDDLRCADREAYNEWRRECGHRAVPEGWDCSWTDASALRDWSNYNLAVADFAHEHRLLWVACRHPYSHYLHDPHNLTLPALLEHWRKKTEKVLFCTLKDVSRLIT